IDPADRLGVPVGLDLDVAVAVEPGEVERLRHARDVAWALRHAIIEQVAVGSMPPPPPTGATALGAGARYRTTEGRELPSIDSPEARAILRSWLACGAPVVEATEGESQGGRRHRRPARALELPRRADVVRGHVRRHELRPGEL